MEKYVKKRDVIKCLHSFLNDETGYDWVAIKKEGKGKYLTNSGIGLGDGLYYLHQGYAYFSSIDKEKEKYTLQETKELLEEKLD